MKKKVIISGLVLMILMAFFQIMIYATDESGFNYIDKINTFTTSDGNADVINPINNVAGTAITIAQTIAVGVAIIMLIVLAMKYMMSAPGDKATIKKHAVVYIVGAVIMFAATAILEIIRKFAAVLS